MYGTYFPLSKENILDRVSQYEIFKFYVPWFEPGRSIKTPFANENRPSFWTKVDYDGNIFFKDFGRGYTGDCFKLVMLLFGCDFHTALYKINEDIKLGLGTPNSKKINLNYADHQNLIQREKVIPEETEVANISYRTRDWQIHDIHFWISHGCSQHVVNLLGVNPIDAFWIGSKYYKADKYAYAWNTSNNRVKIYQPYNKSVGPNNEHGYLKWRSNTNNQALQGESILPSSGHILLFQSSLKDIACVKSLFNVPSVAPNGEHGIIPKEKRDDFENRFERIGVLYDNDEAGIKSATQICEESNYELFILPTVDLKTKDPSDFVHNGYLPVLRDFFREIVKIN